MTGRGRLACVASLVATGIVLAACAQLGGPTPQGERATPSAVASETAGFSANGLSAKQAEALRLLDDFAMPKDPGDPGYASLGPDGNDLAGWYRGVVLSDVEVRGFLHSVVPQREDAASTAGEWLGAFDDVYRSKGATAAYDAVMAAQAALETTQATPRDTELTQLEPSLLVFGLLSRQRSIHDGWPLQALSVSDDGLLSATYVNAQTQRAITVELSTVHDANGRLRVNGFPDYGHVRDALRSQVDTAEIAFMR